MEKRDEITDASPTDVVSSDAKGHRGRLIAGVAGAVVVGVALVAAAVAYATRPIPVIVDGHRRMVPQHTTVAGLLAKRTIAIRNGDLIAVISRRVLRSGEGVTGTIMVDSRLATLGTEVHEDSVVSSVVGTDVVEQTRSARVTIAPGSHFSGHGPYVVLSDPGQEGVRIVTRGAVSGELVTTTVIAQARPGMITRHGYTGRAKVIALTFDDGPWPGTTQQILAILAKYKIKATFFMIGTQVERNAAVARAVAKAGMPIGNHTQTHQGLAKLSASKVMWQIRTDQSTIVAATGVRPLWLRPPGGEMSRIVYQQANAAHMRLMLWDIDPNDWKRPPTATIVSRVLSAARPGAVVLMHDGGGDRSNTVAALPTIITKLLKAGYHFETLDQLFGR